MAANIKDKTNGAAVLLGVRCSANLLDVETDRDFLAS